MHARLLLLVYAYTVGLLTTSKGKTSEIYRKLLLLRQLAEFAGEHAVTVKLSHAGDAASVTTRSPA